MLDRHAQNWSYVRSGNTFSLRATTMDLCLEVDHESRNGAAIRQQPCTGAANQLWSIDALRENDFEPVSDNCWGRRVDRRPDGHAFAAGLIGGRAICRSADAAHWLGTVDGAECSGTHYSGAPVKTSAFDTLFQRP